MYKKCQFIYLLLHFLLIKVSSTKPGPSEIFELKTNEKPSKHLPGVMGLYQAIQATSNTSNNFTVYKRMGTEMYIYVRNGIWIVDSMLSSDTDTIVMESKANSEGEIPKEPPSSQWSTYKKNGAFGSDIDIQWKLYDCCDEINFELEDGIKSHQAKRTGKFRKTEGTSSGRFIYQQINGNNVMYYKDHVGWYIGTQAQLTQGKGGIKYLSSPSCPVGKSKPDTHWQYYSSWTWKDDDNAVAKCWIRDVSNVICLTENAKNATLNTTCRFPFRFRGKIYESCIPAHDNPSKAWCSTGDETEDGFYKYDEDNWHFCQTNCTQEKDVALPLPATIVLSGATPLVVLIIIVLSVQAVRKLGDKEEEIVEENPVYGLGDEDDTIEAKDENSIYGEDDEYESV